METLSYLGRLDQIIYVPLPDEQCREDILKTVLQKWSVAKDVDLRYLARVLNGASGADIVALCRIACKAAIRESIENKQQMESSNLCHDSNTVDPVEEIRRDHFEQAMKLLPSSVASNNDMHKYEAFARMWQSPYGYNTSFPIFNWPQNINEGGNVKQGSAVYTDDDDLYA
ncbi:unnamed protein product [Rotaria sp. Silwood1]|nr:unnamed protein product [Rotaria sp. Silwood1]